MKIAGIQLKCGMDIEKNIKQGLKFLDLAIENEAKIICFQELSFYPWFPQEINDNYFDLACTIDDSIFDDFKNRAKQNNVIIILPFFEKDDTKGIFFNSAILINTEGKIIGRYRKVHVPLIPYWEEKYYFKNGELGFPVFETNFCKIGIMIGWDVFFPEVSRILTLNGADIIFAPTASAFSSQPRWLKVIGANALMNTVFIARINRTGKEGELDFYGGSFCFSPDGGLVSEPAGEGEGIVLWNINLDDLFEVRRLFPFLKDRIEKEYLEIAGLKYSELVKMYNNC